MSVFETADGLGLAELVRKGEVTATELLDEAIERVDQVDSVTHLIADRYHDFARQQIADGLPDGPFTGVPFVRKDDGADIEGLSTTLGMGLLKDAKAPATRTLAHRYMDAGLVFFASTKVPPGFVTFDCERSWYGPCLNPWDPTRTSGGSSAGTGAAVGAGAIPMGHGNDGGGSLRIPAAWCGAFTMKPSRGRLPEGPVYHETWMGFATEGHITRSVRDNAALLDATMGMELGSRYTAPQPARPYLEETKRECPPLRIALQTKDFLGNDFHPHHRDAVDEAAALFEELGHRVEIAQPNLNVDELSDSLYNCVADAMAEFTDIIGDERGRPVDNDELEVLLASFVEHGRTITARDYSRINNLSMETAHAMAVFMENHDILVSPTMPTPALARGEIYRHEHDFHAFRHHQNEHLNMTQVENLTGQPAASIPLFQSPDSLPIGIMAVGRYGDESTLYSLSAQLERARPWWDRVPDLTRMAHQG